MVANVEQIKRSIQELPAMEQDRILQWLEEKRDKNGTPIVLADRRKSYESLRWLKENRDKYPGKWVALDGERLIAVGSRAAEVYNKAKEEGIQIPFVELITAEEPTPFTGGWIS